MDKINTERIKAERAKTERAKTGRTKTGRFESHHDFDGNIIKDVDEFLNTPVSRPLACDLCPPTPSCFRIHALANLDTP